MRLHRWKGHLKTQPSLVGAGKGVEGGGEGGGGGGGGGGHGGEGQCFAWTFCH